ncbi:lonely Cys domain-containing protein, partial [Streptomyces albus subsp. chlorinus]|nr:lonely Cys domain-containing protein [Streptomyces albus subsp. chlorinus]
MLELGRVLNPLNRRRPAGLPPLGPQHFTVRRRGLPPAPADENNGQSPRPTLIQFSSAPRAEAVDLLDRLRRQDKMLRRGPMNLDVLARRVLHLTDEQNVDQDVRNELLDLVTAADRAGRATSLAALGAFHVQQQGVFDDRFRFTAARSPGDPAGLNWTSVRARELDTATGERITKDEQGKVIDAGADEPSWEGDEPAYVVAAAGDRKGVVVPWPDGTTRKLRMDEFAELLAHDPVLAALPKDVPIVLAVPRAGHGLLFLPRLLAFRTGRTVHAHSGDLEVIARPGAPARITVVHHPGKPEGDWVPSPPDLDPGSPDDLPYWHHDVETSAMVSLSTKKQSGRAAFTPAEMAGLRGKFFRRMDRVREFAHLNVATGTLSRRFVPTDPDEAEPAGYQSAHGGPDGILLPLEGGGSRRLDGQEAEQWARARRNSMSAYAEGQWADLEICWAGSGRNGRVPEYDQVGTGLPGPYVADPLEHVSIGQRYANGLRRKVRCTIRVSAIGADGAPPNRVYFRVLYSDPRGRLSSRGKFFPEPRAGELLRRARAIGYSGPGGRVSAQRRTRTLRLVRALRLVLGNEVDDAVRVEKNPGYAKLLRGAAALERMWYADGRFGAAGPFTMDLFHRIVEATLPAGRMEPRRADYRAVLLKAADTASGTRLGDFVTLPPAIEAASAWKNGAPDPSRHDATVAALLDVAHPQVDDSHRSRAFWARVKAHELLDSPGLDFDGLARKALHLEASDPVDAARRAQLWALVHTAFARGRDATDHDVLAAFHLELAGAFDPGNALTDPLRDGEYVGYDWSVTGPRIQTLDTSRIRTPGGLVRAPWAGKDRRDVDRAAPFVVRGSYDARDRGAVRLRFGPGQPVRRVPFAELAELLAYHPLLTTRALNAVVVLDIPGFYRSALADVLNERLGRTATTTRARTGIAHPGGQHHPVLSLSPSSMDKKPTAASWRLQAPVDPVHPGEAPPQVRTVTSDAAHHH